METIQKIKALNKRADLIVNLFIDNFIDNTIDKDIRNPTIFHTIRGLMVGVEHLIPAEIKVEMREFDWAA